MSGMLPKVVNNGKVWGMRELEVVGNVVENVRSCPPKVANNREVWGMRELEVVRNVVEKVRSCPLK